MTSVTFADKNVNNPLLAAREVNQLKAAVNSKIDSGDLTEPLTIGTPTGQLVIEVDGTIRFDGTATVWEDLRENLNGKNLYSTPGKADFDFTNNWIVLEENGSLSTAGDVVAANFQIPHAVKTDSTAYLHLHWIQTTDTSRTISGEYRIQSNGDTPTTAWTSFSATCTDAADNVYSWDAAGLVQITNLAEIDLTDAAISSLVQVKLTRTDSNASNDMHLLYMDMHIEIDTVGSRTEYTK